eukprot:2991426-Alexandrium_andersonii.AAC.1
MCPVRNSKVQPAPALGCAQRKEPSSGPCAQCCSSNEAMWRGSRMTASPQWKCHTTAVGSGAGPAGGEAGERALD